MFLEVPELPGCFAAGETLDELFASLREGIKLYIEKDGHPSDQDCRSGSNLPC
jgi:predicted RNase H-like HicB family nuclease